MDVKRLERVDDNGLEQWRPVLKAEFPLAADDVAHGAGGARRRGPGARARRVHARAARRRGRRAEPGAAAVAVHKRRGTTASAGCMAELSEVRAEDALDAHDRRRVRGSGARAGRGARARARRRAPNVCFPRGLKTLLGLRRAPLRRDRRRDELGQVPHRRASRGRRVADGRRPRRGDEAGRGARRDRSLGAEPMERTVDGDRGMVDEAERDGVEEIAAVGTAGLRIAANSEAFVEAVRERCGRRDRGHLRRGGGPARVPRGDVGAGRRRRLARRLRHRRRQLGVHLRPGGPRRGAVQRRTSAPRGSPSGSGSTAPSTRRRSQRGLRRDRGRPRAARRPRRRPDAARRDGRRGHEPRGGPARARDLRPGRRAGHGARPRGDRSPDRALPHAKRRSAARDRRAPARSAPR